MSKYAQKKHSTPTCTQCSDRATKIALIQGVPYWLCDTHFHEHQRGRTA